MPHVLEDFVACTIGATVQLLVLRVDPGRSFRFLAFLFIAAKLEWLQYADEFARLMPLLLLLIDGARQLPLR